MFIRSSAMLSVQGCGRLSMRLEELGSDKPNDQASNQTTFGLALLEIQPPVIPMLPCDQPFPQPEQDYGASNLSLLVGVRFGCCSMTTRADAPRCGCCAVRNGG